MAFIDMKNVKINVPRDGESSSSSYSPSSFHTTSPNNEDSSWPILICKGTRST